MAKRHEREVQRLAILAALQEPGGRERTNEDIAVQCGSSVQLVRNVRKANPTPEEKAQQERETDENIRKLDESGIFPGIYKWHMARKGGDAQK